MKAFQIQKDDLRYELYSMITTMLQDNIDMRLKINQLMSNCLYETQNALQTFARFQLDPDSFSTVNVSKQMNETPHHKSH